jgi:hypothetical protein
MEQLAINTNTHFNALLSDEVVMEWLMDLESDCQDEQELQVEEEYRA